MFELPSRNSSFGGKFEKNSYSSGFLDQVETSEGIHYAFSY
jgi:hypothetical protein